MGFIPFLLSPGFLDGENPGRVESSRSHRVYSTVETSMVLLLADGTKELRLAEMLSYSVVTGKFTGQILPMLLISSSRSLK